MGSHPVVDAFKEPGLWAVIAVIAGPGGLLTLWLRSKLRLSDDAAAAVAHDGPKPVDYDQALIVLADRVGRQDTELTNLKVYLPQVIGWGHRGWAHVHADHREPLPVPPEGGVVL